MGAPELMRMSELYIYYKSFEYSWIIVHEDSRNYFTYILKMIFFSALLLSAFAVDIATAAGCPYGHGGGHNPHTSRPEPMLAKPPAKDKKGVMFMNRISPYSSTLYIANSDGTNERQLLHGKDAQFDYHASISPDGKWITFTSERAGDGQSDIYRARPDGSDLEKLVASPYVEDARVLSPNGKLLAYVTTQTNFTANIYVKDLETHETIDLTNAHMGANTSPHGFFRPNWSPDGEWLAFSSDRNTRWIGNTQGQFWEHPQHLSVYAVRPNGSDFRQVVSKKDYALGTPRWSPDGSRITFYEMLIDDTYQAHTPAVVNVTSQIASVDAKTGKDYRYHTFGAGCKITAQWLPHGAIGFSTKVGSDAGINYVGNNSAHYTRIGGDFIRNPFWSLDGKSVIYEKQGWDSVRPMNKLLYSWDPDWEYRFSDTFPTLSNQGSLAITQSQLGNGSLITSRPNGADSKVVFDAYSTGQLDPKVAKLQYEGAFQSSWSQDGKWLAFGLGTWFGFRNANGGWIYKVNADGTSPVQLTNETAGHVNSGYPSVSPDGKKIVYRDFGTSLGLGLRVLDLETHIVHNLTDSWDNLPQWSPDGKRIMFTRRTFNNPASYNLTDVYDIYTIRPDGTDLKQLTTSGANDAHGIWAPDGGILWSAGMYGFRDECAIYDNAHQPYGKIMWMNAEGSDFKVLTESLWEDGQPAYVPRKDFF